MVDSDLRNTLTKHASQYYAAKENENSDRTQEIAEEIGFDPLGADCLGSGGGRVVFDLTILGYPDLCVKLAIPHSKWDGVDQNEREVQLWETLSLTKKEYLVEVVDSGPDNYWIIMKQGEPVEQLPYQWLQDAKFHLRDTLWEKDLSEDNIVKVNGEYKFCDYGVGNQ
jgi:hypothetical protein